jgi:hypothetical protein
MGLTRGAILFAGTDLGRSQSWTVRSYADLTPRIGPHRFGIDLIAGIDSRLDGEKSGTGSSPVLG